jgi:hypothetical protein
MVCSFLPFKGSFSGAVGTTLREKDKLGWEGGDPPGGKIAPQAETGASVPSFFCGLNERRPVSGENARFMYATVQE